MTGDGDTFAEAGAGERREAEAAREAEAERGRGRILTVDGLICEAVEPGIGDVDTTLAPSSSVREA